MVFFIVNIILMLSYEIQIPYQNRRDGVHTVSTMYHFTCFW